MKNQDIKKSKKRISLTTRWSCIYMVVLLVTLLVVSIVSFKKASYSEDNVVLNEYSILMSTVEETSEYSGFMGSKDKNVSYVRNNIIGVTFYKDNSYADGHTLLDDNCWDVSKNKDGSIIAWTEGEPSSGYKVYVAPSVSGVKMKAQKDVSYMLANFKFSKSDKCYVEGLDNIDFSETDTANYFAYNSYLHKIKYPDTLNLIGDYAFAKSSRDKVYYGFTVIDIPKTVRNIGECAFMNCSSLNTIEIPAGVLILNDRVFKGCTGLNEVVLNDSIVHIGNEAFYGCESLESIHEYGSVKMPDSICTIGESAFEKCSSLSYIDLPDNVSTISERLLMDCVKLSYVALPTKCKEIGNNAFANDATIEFWMLPKGLDTISDYAFRNCTGTTTITIPSSVQNLSDNAFDGCTNLVNINRN